MKEPLYITDEPLKPGLDYYYLRAEGIRFIQELTGSFWTDYNEHDPGVTILEQLCFALTDLSYRTDFEIKDHFYSRDKNDFSFLKPNEIFPNNALTISDYRKLIFDSVFELNNVWVFPLSEKISSMNGLYKILLDVTDQVKEKGIQEQVINKVKLVYWNNRNICEDIEEIKIVEHIPVSFHANIEIDGKISAETILANIYFKLTEYLNPEIRFYSLEELINLGYEIDGIYNGPLLKHGFIRTEELCPKPSRILISDLIKIIMQIEGVISVKNLYLKIDQKIYENQIEIGEEQLPKLHLSFQPKDERTVNFFRGSVQYHNIDYTLVKRKLNELTSANKRVYRLSEETINIPEGESLDLEEYFSVQNDFPLLYGIGEEGIPHNPDNKRKAQAKQMKGYLLLFEQIMANYLSQLAHVKDLFSLNTEIRQTYFYQSLEKSVPNVKLLLKQKKYQFEERNGFSEFENFLSYETGLPDLVKMRDQYAERRNRFLDYLLAIHGESYMQYSFEQFNFYFDEAEFEKHLIQNKTRLLRSLSFINQNRSKAFNYKSPGLNTDNITGLEAKISLLLGLGTKEENNQENYSYRAHSLMNGYTKSELKLLQADATKFRRKLWDAEAKIKSSLIDTSYIIQHFDFVDTDDADITDFSEAEHKLLLQRTLPFRSKTITEKFLKEGLNIEQYKMGEISQEGSRSWLAIFTHKNEEESILIGIFQTEKEANVAIQLLLIFLRDLNIETEGLHILEHILLRPDQNDQTYGIFMLSPSGTPLLKSTRLYNFEERKIVIEELKKHIGYYDNYSVEATKDKDFEVHFKTADAEHTFVSVVAKPSVEETHADMESLYKLMSNQIQIIPYKNKIGLYVRYSEKVDLIPEDFFSYRSSILIPIWTARFSNSEFRAIAEDIIFENSPANVSLDVLWLKPDDMEDFEKEYYAWMEEKAKENPDTARLEELNTILSSMLINLKNRHEE